MNYVNRRFVRDRILTHAVLEGYETLLMKGRYPAVVIYLEIPFEEVDVNVHPAKYEVRFRRQSDIHDTVTQAVRENLKGKAKEPSAQPFLRRSPGQVPFAVHERPLLYAVPVRETGLEAARSESVVPAGEAEKSGRTFA